MDLQEISGLFKTEIESKNFSMRNVFKRNAYLISSKVNEGMKLIRIHELLKLENNGKKLSLSYFKNLYYWGINIDSEIKKTEVTKTETPNTQVNNENYYKGWKEVFPFIAENLIEDLIAFGCTPNDGEKWKKERFLNTTAQIRKILIVLKGKKEAEKFNIS